MMMCANRHSMGGISELMRDKHDSNKVPNRATLLNRIDRSSVADTHRCGSFAKKGQRLMQGLLVHLW